MGAQKVRNLRLTDTHSLEGGLDESPTARVQRGESATARCASTEDHQVPSLLCSASKKGTWPLPAPLLAWVIRTRIHNDRHVGLVRHDDRLGAGVVVQFVFEILRRECFRDHLLRLRLTLGADT